MNIEQIILNYIIEYPGTTILRMWEHIKKWPRGFMVTDLKAHMDKLVRERKIKVLKISSNDSDGTTLDLFFDKNYHIVSFN